MTRRGSVLPSTAARLRYVSTAPRLSHVSVLSPARAQFWFASIKIILIVGLIILSIILTAGGGPSGEVIGGKYWVDPGPFNQYLGIDGSLGRFLGFWAVLTQVRIIWSKR